MGAWSRGRSRGADAAIGVWNDGEREGEFRFMFYRFIEELTITEPQEERKGEGEEQEAVTQAFKVMRLHGMGNHEDSSRPPSRPCSSLERL